jgi:hypothetical protein
MAEQEKVHQMKI